MRRLGMLASQCAFLLLVQTGPARAQSFVDIDELARVHIVYLEVRNDIGDDCFASTRTLESDAHAILRDRGVIVTDIPRFSTNILSLRVIGALAEGTETCTAALDVEMYRWAGVGSANAVRVVAYGALTLVSADRADIFARLRQSASAFITHLAEDIQAARAQAD